MSNQEFNPDDLDFLTPGSIFHREDGRESRFLFLTNKELPKKLREQYPPQVVYADENNRILSCDIERFLNPREFHAVDPELEERLNSLLVPTGRDDGDGDDELLSIDDGEDGGTYTETESTDLVSSIVERVTGSVLSEIDNQIDGADFEEVELDVATAVRFIPHSALPTAVDATALAQAVTSYQQQPSLTDNTIQHSLFIRADAGFSRGDLYAAFSPARAHVNAIFTFEVDTADGPQAVDWTDFVGIYSAVFYGSQMYQVVFTTPLNPAPDTAVSDVQTGVPFDAPVTLVTVSDTAVQAGTVVVHAGQGQALPVTGSGQTNVTSITTNAAPVTLTGQTVTASGAQVAPRVHAVAVGTLDATNAQQVQAGVSVLAASSAAVAAPHQPAVANPAAVTQAVQVQPQAQAQTQQVRVAPQQPHTAQAPRPQVHAAQGNQMSQAFAAAANAGHPQ